MSDENKAEAPVSPAAPESKPSFTDGLVETIKKNFAIVGGIAVLAFGIVISYLLFAGAPEGYQFVPQGSSVSNITYTQYVGVLNEKNKLVADIDGPEGYKKQIVNLTEQVKAANKAVEEANKEAKKTKEESLAGTSIDYNSLITGSQEVTEDKYLGDFLDFANTLTTAQEGMSLIGVTVISKASFEEVAKQYAYLGTADKIAGNFFPDLQTAWDNSGVRKKAPSIYRLSLDADGSRIVLVTYTGLSQEYYYINDNGVVARLNTLDSLGPGTYEPVNVRA